MILVSSPKKPFTHTAKLTARRQAIIAEYEPEIDALYDAVDETAQAVKDFPREWTKESSLEFARKIIGSVLKVPVKDGDDIFQHSCDRSGPPIFNSRPSRSLTRGHSSSLQATWIRNSILNALRKTTKLNTRGISPNFVYQNPTVSLLGKFIHDLTSIGVSQQLDNTVEKMNELVAKCTRNLPTHNPACVAEPQGVVVLISGTTGAVGSSTLAELYKSPSVKQIVVLARKSTTPISVRQKKALEDRGLDSSIVDSLKLVLLEGDLALPRFGLEEDVFLELGNSVTHILHIGSWLGADRLITSSNPRSTHHSRLESEL
jgi:hypothetical protein